MRLPLRADSDFRACCSGRTASDWRLARYFHRGRQIDHRHWGRQPQRDLRLRGKRHDRAIQNDQQRRGRHPCSHVPDYLAPMVERYVQLASFGRKSLSGFLLRRFDAAKGLAVAALATTGARSDRALIYEAQSNAMTAQSKRDQEKARTLRKSRSNWRRSDEKKQFCSEAAAIAPRRGTQVGRRGGRSSH